jgi:hypothetical protein
MSTQPARERAPAASLASSVKGDGINVVIPMGGAGSRFTSLGYRFPKPLIPIAGRPMLLWTLANLRFGPRDTLFVAMRPRLDDDHRVTELLRRELPSLAIVTVPLDFDTRGAAETLFIVTQHMTGAQLRRRTISLDCDTVYFSDVLTSFRRLPRADGCSLYFDDTGSQPIFSYITLKGEPSGATDRDAGDGTGGVANADGRIVTGIAEKVRISRHANTGGYGFASAALLQKYLIRTLDRGVPSCGEYYTSAVIQSMLADGHRFRGVFVPDFSCVGTVPQLAAFLRVLRTARPHLAPPRRFCFDLHGGLVTSSGGREPAACERNVRLARSLARAGHSVAAYAPAADKRSVALLEALGIPRATLHSGKPSADVYVSARGARAAGDTEREVGWECGADEEGGGDSPAAVHRRRSTGGA